MWRGVYHRSSLRGGVRNVARRVSPFLAKGGTSSSLIQRLLRHSSRLWFPVASRLHNSTCTRAWNRPTLFGEDGYAPSAPHPNPNPNPTCRAGGQHHSGRGAALVTGREVGAREFRLREPEPRRALRLHPRQHRVRLP